MDDADEPSGPDTDYLPPSPPSPPPPLLDAGYLVPDHQVRDSFFFNLILGLLCIFGFIVLRGWVRGPGGVYQRRQELQDLFMRPPRLVLGTIRQVWNWVWPLLAVSDADIVRCAGFDALILTRVLLIGLQWFAVMTVLGMAVLIPVYYTNGGLKQKRAAVGDLARISVAAIPTGSILFVLPFLMTYVFIGYGCYVLWINCKCYVQLRLAYFMCLDALPSEEQLERGLQGTPTGGEEEEGQQQGRGLCAAVLRQQEGEGMERSDPAVRSAAPATTGAATIDAAAAPPPAAAAPPHGAGAADAAAVPPPPPPRPAVVAGPDTGARPLQASAPYVSGAAAATTTAPPSPPAATGAPAAVPEIGILAATSAACEEEPSSSTGPCCPAAAVGPSVALEMSLLSTWHNLANFFNPTLRMMLDYLDWMNPLQRAAAMYGIRRLHLPALPVSDEAPAASRLYDKKSDPMLEYDNDVTKGLREARAAAAFTDAAAAAAARGVAAGSGGGAGATDNTTTGSSTVAAPRQQQAAAAAALPPSAAAAAATSAAVVTEELQGQRGGDCKEPLVRGGGGGGSSNSGGGDLPAVLPYWRPMRMLSVLRRSGGRGEWSRTTARGLYGNDDDDDEPPLAGIAERLPSSSRHAAVAPVPSPSPPPPPPSSAQGRGRPSPWLPAVAGDPQQPGRPSPWLPAVAGDPLQPGRPSPWLPAVAGDPLQPLLPGKRNVRLLQLLQVPLKTTAMAPAMAPRAAAVRAAAAATTQRQQQQRRGGGGGIVSSGGANGAGGGGGGSGGRGRGLFNVLRDGVGVDVRGGCVDENGVPFVGPAAAGRGRHGTAQRLSSEAAAAGDTSAAAANSTSRQHGGDGSRVGSCLDSAAKGDSDSDSGGRRTCLVNARHYVVLIKRVHMKEGPSLLDRTAASTYIAVNRTRQAAMRASGAVVQCVSGGGGCGGTAEEEDGTAAARGPRRGPTPKHHADDDVEAAAQQRGAGSGGRGSGSGTNRHSRKGGNGNWNGTEANRQYDSVSRNVRRYYQMFYTDTGEELGAEVAVDAGPGGAEAAAAAEVVHMTGMRWFSAGQGWSWLRHRKPTSSSSGAGREGTGGAGMAHSGVDNSARSPLPPDTSGAASVAAVKATTTMLTSSLSSASDKLPPPPSLRPPPLPPSPPPVAAAAVGPGPADVEDRNGMAVAAVLRELFPSSFRGLVPVCDHDAVDRLIHRWDAQMLALAAAVRDLQRAEARAEAAGLDLANLNPGSNPGSPADVDASSSRGRSSPAPPDVDAVVGPPSKSAGSERAERRKASLRATPELALAAAAATTTAPVESSPVSCGEEDDDNISTRDPNRRRSGDVVAAAGARPVPKSVQSPAAAGNNNSGNGGGGGCQAHVCSGEEEEEKAYGKTDDTKTKTNSSSGGGTVQIQQVHQSCKLCDRIQKLRGRVGELQTVVLQLEERIEETRTAALARPLGTAYFAMFSNSQDAQMLAQCRRVLPPKGPGSLLAFDALPAPAPDDVSWPGLRSTLDLEQTVRRLAVVLPMAVIFVVPIGLLQGVLANLELALCSDSKNRLFVDWFCETQGFWTRLGKSLLTGVLPSVLGLLWTTLAMPHLLYFCSSINRRALSLSAQEREMQGWFWWYSLLNTFLGAVLGGGVFSQLGTYLTHPSAVLERIGTALPQTANFFIQFCIARALLANGTRLIWPHAGSMLTAILRSALRAGRPRSLHAAALMHMVQSARGAGFYNGILQVFMFGCAFAVVAPVILPCCLFFFLTGFFAYRYSILYVYERSYESGGRMWPELFGQMMGFLLLMELFSGAVFVVNKAFTLAIVMWATLTPALLLFWRFCSSTYLDPLDHPPLALVAKEPRGARVDPTVYLPPALRPGAIGWYPEQGKVWEKYGIPKRYW